MHNRTALANFFSFYFLLSRLSSPFFGLRPKNGAGRTPFKRSLKRRLSTARHYPQNYLPTASRNRAATLRCDFKFDRIHRSGSRNCYTVACQLFVTQARACATPSVELVPMRPFWGKLVALSLRTSVEL